MGAGERGVGPWGSRIFCGPLNPAPHPHKTWVGGRESPFLALGPPLLHQLFLPPARAAYGLIMRPNDFASYLLAIGICNLLLYFAFYIIMKVSGGS